MGLQEKCGNTYLIALPHTRPKLRHFLGSLTGKAWGMESGLPLKAISAEKVMTAAARLIDPQVIMDTLRHQYGCGPGRSNRSICRTSIL